MADAEYAIVVGATGAMGQLISHRLASNGLRVIAVARSRDSLTSLVDSLDTESAGQIIACEADITNDSAIEVIQRHIGGKVRVVVHGPGVQTAGGILDAPTEALIDAVNIKAGGMVRVVRAADPYLSAGSRLIAIGGHYGFEPTAYAATAGLANGGLANLIKQYSWAYGSRGVTAHLIAPGPADTERLHRVAEARGQQAGKTKEEILEIMRAESAIGEFTDVEDIAWAVEMLLAPQANSFAGSTLFMDAGRRRGTP